jgi:hypothetical protein
MIFVLFSSPRTRLRRLTVVPVTEQILDVIHTYLILNAFTSTLGIFIKICPFVQKCFVLTH